MAKSAIDSVVMSIDRDAFDRIRVDTIKSDAEQKIDFLMRYVPRMRMSPRNIVEELDILFVKECYPKGYRVIKDGELNDSVYFIRSGVCQSLHPLAGALGSLKDQLTPDEQAKYKYVKLSDLSNSHNYHDRRWPVLWRRQRP